MASGGPGYKPEQQVQGKVGACVFSGGQSQTRVDSANL